MCSYTIYGKHSFSELPYYDFFLQTRLSNTFQLYSDVEQSPFQACISVSVKDSEAECVPKLIHNKIQYCFDDPLLILLGYNDHRL